MYVTNNKINKTITIKITTYFMFTSVPHLSSFQSTIINDKNPKHSSINKIFHNSTGSGKIKFINKFNVISHIKNLIVDLYMLFSSYLFKTIRMLLRYKA